ncbi:MAG: enoyl-CoA hydratase/isomerase family protein [Bacteroidales bacterium]|nr:enoyl-CoA hydratase/isomerase family protein [Bacteroidales bacterium]
MNYQYLKLAENGAVCTVAISAPQSLNALNSTILGELEDFVDHLDCNKFRCLIVTGDGEKSFVAGADIKEMADLDAAQGQTFGAKGARVFRKIETLPIPVIAAVNGFALGGGCELAMACDIRICSSNARFGQPEVGLGIIPGFSGTVRMARLVGMGIAKELIFSGRTMKADEALRIGLVNAVYEPAELMDKAREMAERIATNAPIAVRYAKQCINNEYDMPADEAIAYESKMFGQCFATEDQKNGMQAFINKGKCEFQGK